MIRRPRVTGGDRMIADVCEASQSLVSLPAAVAAAAFRHGEGGDVHTLRILAAAPAVGGVAEIGLVIEVAAAGVGRVAADAAVAVALVDVGDGLSDVGQFRDDRIANALQTDDDAEDQD